MFFSSNNISIYIPSIRMSIVFRTDMQQILIDCRSLISFFLSLFLSLSSLSLCVCVQDQMRVFHSAVWMCVCSIVFVLFDCEMMCVVILSCEVTVRIRV